MELKKKQKADVFRKRGMYLNLGLALALGIVVSAFQWKSYTDGDLVTLGQLDPFYDELIIIPPTVNDPPPPPPKPQIKIVEVDDPVEVETPDFILDVDITQDYKITDPVIFEDEVDDEDDGYIWPGIIEKQPAPVGGMKSFNEFLRKNLKYPRQAQRLRVEGKVFVQFVVSKTGELSEVKVIRGIGAGCDEEAARVIKAHPNWEPGEQRGRPVNVRMVIPIFFQLK